MLLLFVKGGLLPVQEWTYIGDMHMNESNYLSIENHFVRKSLRIIKGEVRWGLRKEVRNILRPKGPTPELEIYDNLGSWL